MKQLLFSLLIILLSTTSVFSQTENQSFADIKFEKTKHDFGKIQKNKKVEYEFVFRNTGTETLIIQDVKASKDIAPSYSKGQLSPGESSSIKIKIYTMNMGGEFTRKVSVSSNAKSGIAELTITGIVEVIKDYPEK